MKPTIDMQSSPLDRGPAVARLPEGSLVQLAYTPPQRWIPSRYTSRALSEDGRLMLWNTLSGVISAFGVKDRERVLERLNPAGVVEPLDRTAEYLRRRGFLVPQQADELQQFRFRYNQEHWRSDRLQLILLASEDCNFRCVYCYEKFRNGTMTPEVREGIRNLVNKRAPRLSELGAAWFGGEPLYGWEAVEDLSPFFKETAEKHGLGHAQTMTTNGYLLTEERATKLISWGCRSFQITIDGLAEEHDCKRVGRDGSSTHAVILENLRSLKQRPGDDFVVAIRVNFDQENVPRLGSFLEALSEDFAGDHRFKLRFRAIGKWGGENDDALQTCGVGEKRQVLRDLREKADDEGLKAEGGIGAARFGQEACYAARPYNFIVSATGKLMKCTVVLDELPENVVGQIRQDGTLELDNERMGKWVNPHWEHDSMCPKCHILPTCQGVNCPLSRVTENRRTCSAIKSELKYEMRYTLEQSALEARTGPELAMAAMD